jgi:outer membrane protein
LLLSVFSFSQNKWDLKRCIEYALQNNVTVRQSLVQAQLTGLNYQQNKLSLYPNLNFSGNSAFNSGNNQDPTTFSRVTQNYLSAGFQLQSSADLFNFYRKRNLLAASAWEAMAATANVGKIQNDIALSTANNYLQVLLAMEQMKIAGVQIEQTSTQLKQVQKMVAVGTLPELNATQLEAQLALDSSNYITASGNVQQAILTLKQFMSMSPSDSFDIETPAVDQIPVEAIADLQPEFVFQEAMKNQPLQKGNDYRLKAAQKMKLASKAAFYPSFSAFGFLGSNYLNFKKQPIYSRSIIGYQSTGLFADAGNGILLDVQSPVFQNNSIAGYIRSRSFVTQLNDNFRKSLGISITVPIFNSGSAKIGYERSLLNYQSAKLQQEQDDLKLKQDIYQAYQSALVALQKFDAGKKTVASNEKAYEFATKRFAIGALSTFDLITTQNNLLRARLENTMNHFDYVFKMKVLEFYKGAGLKL